MPERKLQEGEHSDEFTSLFMEFFGKVQSFLTRMLIVLVISLLLFQGLLRIPPVRAVLSSAERLEGNPIPPVTELLEKFTGD
ncbi:MULTISPECIES: hypothetical protein [Paenibacillus]|uniref:hypothetical protein n=1 Tax=Paenibacillus TaxID=44249 RepID=UPI0008393DEB|nr:MULTISPECIES: hypothetical protein [Paenibacillus]GIP20133.1 hypothetical protein J22TS3_04080 [Paenibacillus sp. J22TS3]